jgi:regulatory protein
MAVPPGPPVHDGRGSLEVSPATGRPDGTSVGETETDPEAAVRSVVLDQLSRSARSRSQLEDTLAKRGLPEDTSGRVLDRFEQVGLVDDVSFARDWVQGRHEKRGISRHALAHELRERGIDAETASDALNVIDDDAEYAAATRLVSAKVGGLISLPRDKQQRRLVALLARRGYSPDLTSRVVQEFLGGADGLELET